jgi:hypothetical protein
VAAWLDEKYPQAAASLLEGLAECFTINWLHLPPFAAPIVSAFMPTRPKMTEALGRPGRILREVRRIAAGRSRISIPAIVLSGCWTDVQAGSSVTKTDRILSGQARSQTLVWPFWLLSG